MERRSVIAIAAASTGAVIAASVAAVAAINASVASSVEPTIGEQVLAIATPEATDLQAVEFTAPASLPSATHPPLPEIVVPVVEVAADTAPLTDTPVTSKSAESVAPTPTKTSTPEASPKPTVSAPTQARIAAEQATALVVAASGGTARSTQATTHGGFDAFAVQVQRSDGSIVTGFVESSSGVIFDWVVDQAAPAPAAPKPTYTDDHDEDDDRKSDDHEDDHESDHDNDHEGDDDDD